MRNGDNDDLGKRNPFLVSIGQLLNYISEHGTSRVLVAAGITIPLTYIVRIPSGDWQTNLMILTTGLSMVIAGSAIRIWEMKSGIFSGRTILVVCQNCHRPVNVAGGLTGKPPWSAQCHAVNIVQ